MKNRWKASVKNENTENNAAESTESTGTSKSKKIGIAMGVVGALLVTAGVAPMFMDGKNLEGDITQQEEVDPLVALLSGGNTDSIPATVTPIGEAVATSNSAHPVTTPTAKPSVKPDGGVPSISPRTAQSTSPSVKPSATPIPANLSEVDKILAEEGAAIPENKNTGKNDMNGSAFGEAETLHSAAGLSNTSTTGNQPTPKTTVQTGNNSVLFLGLLFLVISGIASSISFLRRR